jgi:nicotinate dehydrogenase subunit A
LGDCGKVAAARLPGRLRLPFDPAVRYKLVMVELNVNGLTHQLEVDPATPLLYVLRNDLGLPGAKFGCGLEQCGACVVLVEGEPVYACTRTLAEVGAGQVETVEGLGGEGGPHPLQEAFLELNAAQCGYCTAGILMRAKALLAANALPSHAEIVAALDGHLCRCGAHPRIVRAVERAAIRMRVPSL